MSVILNDLFSDVPGIRNGHLFLLTTESLIQGFVWRKATSFSEDKWEKISFLKETEWRAYLEAKQPEDLYKEDIPIPLATQWALYDLRIFVPEEYRERFYPQPKEGRPNGGKTAVIKEGREEVNVGGSGILPMDHIDKQEAAKQRQKREQESLLSQMMREIMGSQEELQEKLLNG